MHNSIYPLRKRGPISALFSTFKQASEYQQWQNSTDNISFYKTGKFHYSKRYCFYKICQESNFVLLKREFVCGPTDLIHLAPASQSVSKQLVIKERCTTGSGCAKQAPALCPVQASLSRTDWGVVFLSFLKPSFVVGIRHSIYTPTRLGWLTLCGGYMPYSNTGYRGSSPQSFNIEGTERGSFCCCHCRSMKCHINIWHSSWV